MKNISLLAAVVLAACTANSTDRVKRDKTQEVTRTHSALVVSQIRERDLALAFDLGDEYLIAAQDRLANNEALLPQDWYRDVEGGFADTSAEDAMYWENWYEDWKVVSARLAPCSPLEGVISADNTTLCWPEVRLVLQPILYNIRVHARFSWYFADDRAIHALYDVQPDIALPAVDAHRATAYLKAIRAGDTLDAVERADFVALRNQAVDHFMADALSLRDPAFSQSDYEGFGVRPESIYGGSPGSQLQQRWYSLLSEYATPGQLRELTAFSLPFGREPAHLDEWVFVAFRQVGGQLKQQSILLTEPNLGEMLFDYGTSMTATQTSDDHRIYSALSGPGGEAIEASVLLDPTDVPQIGAVIADRNQRLVPHTSCASCHKLNDLRFDFHNFGYLEDRDLTVSPRVIVDMARDLAWLANHR